MRQSDNFFGAGGGIISAGCGEMAKHERIDDAAVDKACPMTLEQQCDHLIQLVFTRYGSMTTIIARVAADDDIDRRFVELAGIPPRTRDDLLAKKALGPHIRNCLSEGRMS